jgi:hypothetical protein
MQYIGGNPPISGEHWYSSHFICGVTVDVAGRALLAVVDRYDLSLW